MSDVIIPGDTPCATCGKEYGNHSAGSRFCPDASGSESTRAAFTSAEFSQ